jgi:hypothetical protein
MADKLTNLHVPTIKTTGSLYLTEPSGPVNACTGITLTLPLLNLLGKKRTLPQLFIFFKNLQ